jgi:hypothetical protein
VFLASGLSNEPTRAALRGGRKMLIFWPHRGDARDPGGRRTPTTYKLLYHPLVFFDEGGDEQTETDSYFEREGVGGVD